VSSKDVCTQIKLREAVLHDLSLLHRQYSKREDEVLNKEKVRLRMLNNILKTELEKAFSPSNTVLRRLQSDDPILDSIFDMLVKHETVHPFVRADASGSSYKELAMKELHRRIQEPRRIYLLCHYSKPNTPVAFISTYLTDTIVREMNPIQHEDNASRLSTTAIFYSVNLVEQGLMFDTRFLCIPYVNNLTFVSGLQGINVAAKLIKHVVRSLKNENQAISTFATLSPIPLFTHWLHHQLSVPSFLPCILHPEDPQVSATTITV